MAFVRIKTIKGKPYAYLVENTWQGNQSKQKVLKYLGGVTHYTDVPVPCEGTGDTYSNRIDSLILSTLLRMGFLHEEQLLRHGDMVVNLITRRMTRNGKPLVLRINEGFLCSDTWNQLRLFVAQDTTPKTAEYFAKLVLEAGLLVDQAQFVQLFELAPKKISATTRDTKNDTTR